MSKFRTLTRLEFSLDPDPYLVAVAQSAAPLVVQMGEDDGIDVALLRSADLLTLLQAHAEPPGDELREAELAAGRVIAADVFDQAWTELTAASQSLRAALTGGDEAEIIRQARWLLDVVEAFLGDDT